MKSDAQTTAAFEKAGIAVVELITEEMQPPVFRVRRALLIRSGCAQPHVGDLSFELRLSPRRKSLEIMMDCGDKLIFVAPVSVDKIVLREFVHDKHHWI